MFPETFQFLPGLSRGSGRGKGVGETYLESRDTEA